MGKRTSSFVKTLEGNRSRSPIRDELDGLGVPVPPKNLKPPQLERWHEIVGALPRGLLSRADISILERMSVAWDQYRQACEEINSLGLLVEGSQGQPVKNPAIEIQRSASAEMQVCGIQLGLSPFARTRLASPNREPEDQLTRLEAAWQPKPAQEN